jgi:hypothetical protein
MSDTLTPIPTLTLQAVQDLRAEAVEQSDERLAAALDLIIDHMIDGGDSLKQNSFERLTRQFESARSRHPGV